MVVTSSTVHRQAEKALADVFNRFFHPLRSVEEPVVSCEISSGPKFPEIIRMHFIRRQHQANHLIVGRICI